MDHKIGDERYLLEHLSVDKWHTKAKAAGWDGQDESFDALRPFCEPERAGVYTEHKDLKSAAKRAREIWKEKPRDSIYGAIMIYQQIFEAARDDSGDLIEGVPPEWKSYEQWEVTADGAICNVNWH